MEEQFVQYRQTENRDKEILNWQIKIFNAFKIMFRALRELFREVFRI